jgi:hypothetical protein
MLLSFVKRELLDLYERHTGHSAGNIVVLENSFEGDKIPWADFSPILAVVTPRRGWLLRGAWNGWPRHILALAKNSRSQNSGLR